MSALHIWPCAIYNCAFAAETKAAVERHEQREHTPLDRSTPNPKEGK